MSASASTIPARPGPELLRQTVVIIGGSAGIGLETARRARAEGASIILTGRIANASNKRRANSAPSAPRPSMPTIRLPCSGSFKICRARLTML
jgi:predicted amino acid dehydrogenase